MTYTLLGRDAETGALFVALASRWPAVGGIVPYFRTGAGLVCAQHHAVSAMAEAVLDKLAGGIPPDQALALAVPAFEPERRQVAALDLRGHHDHWTGEAVDWHTGHAEAPGLLCIGNMLASPEVPRITLQAFREAGHLPLTRRLLHALRAGEAAGGDKRGREAAALRIWPAAYPAVDHLPIDLRADEDDDPIGVLERILARRLAVAGVGPFCR
ncbi:MAG: DUF1028 domain-containing protein [Alphaproteobacteria bacterium]|jgi:uncharacterized Ntn-hydrolase superfamily protein|nr:DUF1028 domain-containing protein [Alphaproteobacteria bacterium]